MPLAPKSSLRFCSLVVPRATQMRLPARSAELAMPASARTMKVCPSWKVVGPKASCATSRPSVQVVLRKSTSTAPLRTASKRSLAPAVFSETNSTASASPKIAAAVARQKSTSKPLQRPRTLS
jgi:hypothetical protein